ncbi:MAG: sigma 54-interacting transcriptional regulator [Myxococcota bacterium]|nr:sigma 54-interacting transcriptional regulator [Myxococcota bacterium]
MNSRYEIIRALGQGGQGQVSLVRDRGRDGLEVALKRVHSDADVEALRREFGVLSSLRHPSLAKAYDFGYDDEGAYFTCEYVDGEELLAWARSAPLPEVVRGLASLLRAVELLHSRGFVHGDLSPSNALVPRAKDPRPKLIDLGSARAPGEPAMVVTPGYAAPEIYAGRGVLRASDLYSIGALISQCLLGIPAFGLADASSIVERQLRGELLVPAPETSAVARLCHDLLAHDPAARPRSALDVIARLSEATEIELGTTLSDLRGAALPGAALCGRDDELATLLSSIDHFDEPESPRVLALQGPLGCGRSALLFALVRRAALDGLAIVGTPGAPLSVSHLVRGLLSLPQDQHLCDPARQQLADFDAMGGNAQADVEGLALAAAEVLSAASRKRPVLLLFDDLDQSSALAQRIGATLARALDPGRLNERPMAVVAAAWSGQEPVDLPNAHTLVLGPLSRCAMEAAVRSMLPGIEVEESLLDPVWLLSAGKPAEIEAVVRLIAQQGGDCEALSHGILSCLAPAQGAALRAMLEARQPLPSTAVRAGLGDAQTSALVDRGLLVEIASDEGVLLRATGAASTGLESFDDAAKLLAQRLAQALEHPDFLGCVGRLRAFCGQRKEAVSLFVDAAGTASRRGDILACAGFFDEALALDQDSFAPWIPTAVETFRRLDRHDDALQLVARMELSPTQRCLLRAELLLERGRHQEAHDISEQALLAGDTSPLLRAVAGAALVHLGRHEEALSMATTALRETQAGSGDTASARLALVAALAALSLGRLNLAGKHLTHATRVFEERQDTLGQLKTVAAKGQLAWRQGSFGEARTAFDRAVRLSEELKDRGRKALYLSSRASMAQLEDDYTAALADYRAALDISTLLGNETLRASVEANLADLLVELGQFREAEHLALRAMERARRTLQPRCERQALLIRGKARLYGGDLVRAEAALNEARRRFHEAGEEAFGLAAQIRLAQLELAKGNAEVALRQAASTRQQADKLGCKKEWAKALAVEARACLEAGKPPLVALALFEQAAKSGLGDDEGWRLEWHMSKALDKAEQKAQAVESKARARLGLSRMLGRIPEELQKSFLGYGEAREIEPGGQVDKALSPTDRWARDLEMLMGITQELTRELDPKRLLQLILERAVEITGAERGMVILPRNGKLEPVVSHQIAEEVEVSFSRQVAEKVVAEGRPTLAVDALDDERFRGFASVAAMKLRSILAVPLALRRKMVGVIYLDSRLRSGVFGEADRHLLEAFGAQAAVALETARLVSESNRRSEELERANAEVLSLSRQLEEKLERREADLRRVGALLKQSRSSDKEGIIGRSPAMQTVRRLVERVATADVPVYICGPSGTGKELVARAIHACSERSGEPFVAVNCGALPDKLLASELFGHAKGAFTGATSDRKGLFELAHGGVLLLDEVGDMGPEMQTHLLRVLQDGKFRRLGSNDEISVNVRFLCASNKNLDVEVSAGRFRGDLFYRLDVVRLEVPALRDRRDDIPLLVEHFLHKHADKSGPRNISRKAMDLLLAAEWPGNVRELENEVQRAIAMSAEGQPILPEDLSARLQGRRATADEAPMGKGHLKDRVDAFEKVIIERALDECNGNATLAAKTLGLSRAGLYKKLGKHQVER